MSPKTLPRRPGRDPNHVSLPQTEIELPDRIRTDRDRVAQKLEIEPTLIANRSQLAQIARFPRKVGDILLPWQALVAGYAWVSWRGARDRWLPRILALELVFLSVFTLFYAGRYHSLPLLRFWQYVVIVLLVGGGWLVVDIVRELRRRRGASSGEDAPPPS